MVKSAHSTVHVIAQNSKTRSVLTLLPVHEFGRALRCPFFLGAVSFYRLRLSPRLLCPFDPHLRRMGTLQYCIV